MAESKTKSKASGKPASAVAETKPTVKTAKPAKAAADKAAAKSGAVAKPRATKAKEAEPGVKKTAAKRNVKAFNTPSTPVSAELRYRMIAEAAYYIAQQRGFAAGDAGADWAQAEAQIAMLLDQQ